ncbi:hypothetical protein [Roseateles flavus]|uniref:Uncharacterized protein n=1 Tax=Roseateles flavus TaxID=3149041 RepID=A0ABV0GEV6_9BURK
MAARASEPGAVREGGSAEGPLWLLLHELDDASAEPLRRCLAPAARAQGGELLSLPAPALLQARHWSLRMDSAGRTRSALQLGPHRIEGHRLRAVLNRLGPPRLAGTHADAAYQQQEWQAILSFWLASLPCPVLNPAHPTGLCGPQGSPSWWRLQASHAGLPAWPETSSPPPGREGRRLLVLGSHCLPDVQARAAMEPALRYWTSALPAFAARLDLALLEVWLCRDGAGRWVLDRADPRPELRQLDADLVAALLACLGLGPDRRGQVLPRTAAGSDAWRLLPPTLPAEELHP